MKVAIIGSGASGLTAIKCCIDEGLHPVCFEKQDEIGGLWNYVPTQKDGATVYESTVINTSKEMMCFSDFPIPREFPNFMHNSKVLEYFQLYAQKFGLLEHINFHTEVLSCKPAGDFAKNGQWRVLTRNVQTKEEKTDLYDGVMVCVGHHAIPHYPLDDFPGIENFEGKYIHSHDYRNHKGFEKQKVVVIGIGNSGGDIAVELSRHAKQVYLSTRRGAWIFNRIGTNGLPGDYIGSRKFQSDITNPLPFWIVQKLIRKSLDERLDHEKYGLKPKHGPLSQHPVANDDIANRIITGSIQVRTNVVRFTETSAIFEDGTEEQIDNVIFATGYTMAYPFLSEDVLKVDENQTDLYKHIYPVSLARNTLAVIGCIQPLGAINPIAELQCRWATRVIKGAAVLPCASEMKNDIDKKRINMRKQYVNSRRHTVQVNYVEYMDELAEQISGKPNVLKWFLIDPVLAMKIYFGPAVPYLYRLEGPGKWSQARDAIMTVRDRVLYPLQTRRVETDEKGFSLFQMSSIVGLLWTAIVIVCFWWVI